MSVTNNYGSFVEKNWNSWGQFCWKMPSFIRSSSVTWNTKISGIVNKMETENNNNIVIMKTPGKKSPHFKKGKKRFVLVD